MQNDLENNTKYESDTQGYTMTVRDVATMFNLSEATIRSMAINKTVPSIKIGRQFRFNKKGLLTHLYHNQPITDLAK
tara:strand:+ start:1591 stop:1821 length:231 start_codon:yes stop_codon:yes gene_type:complete